MYKNSMIALLITFIVDLLGNFNGMLQEVVFSVVWALLMFAFITLTEATFFKRR